MRSYAYETEDTLIHSFAVPLLCSLSFGDGVLAECKAEEKWVCMCVYFRTDGSWLAWLGQGNYCAVCYLNVMTEQMHLCWNN